MSIVTAADTPIFTSKISGGKVRGRYKNRWCDFCREVHVFCRGAFFREVRFVERCIFREQCTAEEEQACRL